MSLVNKAKFSIAFQTNSDNPQEGVVIVFCRERPNEKWFRFAGKNDIRLSEAFHCIAGS